MDKNHQKLSKSSKRKGWRLFSFASLKGSAGTLDSSKSIINDDVGVCYSVCSVCTFGRTAQYEISLKSTDYEGV